MKHFFGSILIVTSLVHFAHAQVNFVPTALSDFAIGNGGANGGKVLKFKLTVTNSGDAYAGPLSVKPMLIPTDSRPNGFVNDKGVSLPMQISDVNLKTGDSIVFQYVHSLSRIPERDYALAAFVNSDRSVTESNTDDDIFPDLVDVGHLSVNGPDPLDQAMDYYSDVMNFMAQLGGASHSWRFFKRGDLPTSDIHTIFLMADIGQRKIYASSYEKVGYWADMGITYDERGRESHYDIYSQAPDYENVPAGHLAMLSLINFTDSIPEADTSNNLDIRHFDAQHLAAATTEIWSTSVRGQTNIHIVPLQLSTSYRAVTTWSQTQQLPAWVKSDTTEGQLSESNAVATVQFVFDPTGLPAGEKTAPLSFASTEFPGETQNVKISYFVLDHDLPGLTPPSELDFIGTQGQSIDPQNLVLSNPTKDPVKYKLSTDAFWIFFGAEKVGEIPAQGQVSIPIAVENQVLEYGAAGNILVETNRINGSFSVPVIYQGNPPNRSR